MKFNEKLIELRKKEGLSQEELGYKLNVTRQTISKWELGQTTPEMDKLLEISKLFNISVDELINQEETETQTSQNQKIEDQPIVEKSNTGKIIKIVIFGFLVIVLLSIIGLVLFGSGIFNIFNKAKTFQEDTFNETLGTAETIINSIDSSKNTITIQNFNGHLEIFNGTRSGVIAKSVLDTVITSNKTEDLKITVKYEETETQDESEIRNIKQSFEDFDDYEIYFEYDSNGFINKMIIEKL